MELKLNDLKNLSKFNLINLSYIENLYSDSLINKKNLNLKLHELFNSNSKTNLNYLNIGNNIENIISYTKDDKCNICKIVKIKKLINYFRCFGYNFAKINPIDIFKKKQCNYLQLSNFGFTENDSNKTFNINIFNKSNNCIKLSKLYKILNKIYCGSIGIEYMYLDNNLEKNWIQQYIEPQLYNLSFSKKEKKNLLKELVSSEIFEKYLGSRFPGYKRFSLEGCDVLIPIFKEIIRYSSNKYLTKEITIGMAHRGRLNVLVNILGKNPQDLFDEFIGKKSISKTEYGDVKYHQGFVNFLKIGKNILKIILANNPSHLEIVSPVIMGISRAIRDKFNYNNTDILPITLHGDAAIIGQGVVQETLNMSNIPAYNIGGTIRIVINNQIGFTTSKISEIRSSKYCTDIAKMIQAPIIHVNVDDIESTIFSIRMAIDFRNLFKKDIIIDLVCYRRQGHNESDDPFTTQPILYKNIKKHPTSLKIYANYLLNKNIINNLYLNKSINEYRESLIKDKCVVKETSLKFFHVNSEYRSNIKNKNLSKIKFSNLKVENLITLAKSISYVPSNINMHNLVSKIYKDRLSMSKCEKLIDWGFAESLAYASLLNDGFNVRIIGEDSERGTFFHRHAVIHDQKNELTYIPLKNISKNQGNFNIWNSVLSEEAALAFEYGYSSINLFHTLVVWEAQFGDFANGAQVVIDQFISSGEQKWSTKSNLVLMLPHGYEGQGPEHSSARLERYLQICAGNNIKICVPSTASQLYLILRHHMLDSVYTPLVIITPKSLLRNKYSFSSFNEISSNIFRKIIYSDNINYNKILRVVICTGKVYYDLLLKQPKNIDIIKIEQLYPFPIAELKTQLNKYKNIVDIVWCQEEPKNSGAWIFVKSYILDIIDYKYHLIYAGRPYSASPATGYLFVHNIQQLNLINSALDINVKGSKHDR
ncbi:MAG: 2-oxoglutarate dehydrogenase E1 component [Enterobacterales bacterium]